MGRRALVVLVVLVVAAYVGYLQWQLRSLRIALQHALVSPRIIERITEKPVPIEVRVPGATRVVTVTVEKVIEKEKPIVRVVAPSVPCHTEEECRRIFGAAEQRFTINTGLKGGTVVSVLLNGEVVNLPLAADYKFSIQGIMSERGVFHALIPAGSPLLQTTTITTETRLAPTLPGLSYNLAVVPFQWRSRRPNFATGIEYQNRWNAGIYRISAQYEFPGIGIGAAWVLPIR